MSFAEAAVVIDWEQRVTFRWLPPGRSAVYLPDGRELWEHLLATTDTTWGVAHIHPGTGIPEPSAEDLSTFLALERGLGRRFSWPIITSNGGAIYAWRTTRGVRSYQRAAGWIDAETHPDTNRRFQPWLTELRRIATEGGTSS